MIKNLRFILGKFLIRSNDVVVNGRGGEENGYGYFIEISWGLLNGRFVLVFVINGIEGGFLSLIINGELSC